MLNETIIETIPPVLFSRLRVKASLDDAVDDFGTFCPKLESGSVNPMPGRNRWQGVGLARARARVRGP